MITEGAGIPLAVSLAGRNRNDVTQLIPLIEAIPPVRGRRGRPRQRPKVIYADRGYDHDSHRRWVHATGIGTRIARRGTNTAPDSASTGGWSSRPLPCCTGSDAYASAGRSATTSMKPS